MRAPSAASRLRHWGSFPYDPQVAGPWRGSWCPGHRQPKAVRYSEAARPDASARMRACLQVQRVCDRRDCDVHASGGRRARRHRSRIEAAFLGERRDVLAQHQETNGMGGLSFSRSRQMATACFRLPICDSAICDSLRSLKMDIGIDAQRIGERQQSLGHYRSAIRQHDGFPSSDHVAAFRWRPVQWRGDRRRQTARINCGR